MRPKSTTLTPQELEIMKLVWQRQTATVRDIYEALRARRKIAYTTVMTMMNILAEKGHLRKRSEPRTAPGQRGGGAEGNQKVRGEQRAYVYQSVRPQAQVVKTMVREFINRVFDGSAEPLLVHLVKDRRLSEKERQEIARLIRES